MPRLVNRGALGRTSTPSTPASASTSVRTALPAYQPPSCPLNAEGRRALGELANNRASRAYETQLKDATRNLGLSVSDLNERLVAQSERLEGLRSRRSERGTEKTEEESRLEKHLVELEEQVDNLTRKSERAVRNVIDKGVELADESVVLSELYSTAVTQQVSTQRRPNRAAAAADASDGEDQARDADEDRKEPPPASTVEAFRERLAQKVTEYHEGLTPAQRYAQNNDYAGFKKLWHDAAAGEDGPPLPDASRWFRANGHPVMVRPAAAARRGAVEENDDDDEIAVAREVLSLNCPLTLRVMEEPYSNTKCKHTFEKAAILDYLPARGGGIVQCPQTGCSQTFSRAAFDADFYLDEAILRRIQRAKQAQQDQEMHDDDDDDYDDEDLTVRGQRRLRKEVPKKERLSLT